jgi:hypothetical protein
LFVGVLEMLHHATAVSGPWCYHNNFMQCASCPYLAFRWMSLCTVMA